MPNEQELADLEKQLAGLEEQIAALTKRGDGDGDGDGKGDAPIGRWKPRDDVHKAGKTYPWDKDWSEDETGNDEGKSKSKSKSKSDKEEDEKMTKGTNDEADKLDKSKEGQDAGADKDKQVDKVDKAADESLVLNGQTILKSQVGEAHFAIFKAQADALAKAQQDINKAQEEVAKERDLRLTAELKKQADDLYSHVPGTIDERANMLKAMQSMEEPLRKSFEAALAACEKLSKTAFDTLGSDGGKGEASKADFEKAVNEIRARDNCTRQEAMAKARRENPDAFRAYQGN